MVPAGTSAVKSSSSSSCGGGGGGAGVDAGTAIVGFGVYVSCPDFAFVVTGVGVAGVALDCGLAGSGLGAATVC